MSFIKNMLKSPLSAALTFAAAAFIWHNAAIAADAPAPYAFQPHVSEMQKQQDEDAKNAPKQIAQPAGSAQNPNDPDKPPPFVDEYSDKYKGQRENADEKDEKITGVLPNYIYAVNFIRDPAAPSGKTTLRIATPIEFTGCAKLKQPVAQIAHRGPIIEITISDAEIDLEKSVRYPHYQCDTHSKYAFVDVPLNRDDLLKEGVNHISVKGSIGKFNDVELKVSEEKMEASAKPVAIMDADTCSCQLVGGGQVTYWFYPENTVILNAPRAPMTDSAKMEITHMAMNRGLIPLQDTFKDFEPPHKNSGLYFTDPSGALKAQIAAAGKPVLVDAIQVTKVYSGLQGQYNAPADLQVFARLPANNE